VSAVVAEREVAGTSVAATLNLVDEQNPWLGLDSFSEETRQYFHGRDEEVAELARRVQRKTLSILFGQSGLGKTSILRAGIVPRLRREGFCPVYVRIDYARESPAPSQQIKQAIFRATEGTGRWTKPGAAVPGESPWEFLHHRDDFLCDDEGRQVTPLLIFDQFEEIFTLGQNDEFGRARAREFIDDLADLIENRPPKALEVMIDSEDTIVERFDFDRADYRILIALREDYLAHLEGLKGEMPAITQNRMRLARMTGQQALAAVMKPGGRLVNEEVAESIVRFVAGGAELRNAEVEPSLLSLVCRELNNTRTVQKRAEISADLLAGSRETILQEFYERALADQPPGVRRFVEDEMLTESGFRESLAEERVLRAFEQAGAPAGALALLVNRRLLRIEERLDVRRVELTHDVLCAVVTESRNQRHEREAKEEAERQLAAQKAREAATHRALVRARQVAAGCAVLAIVAIGGGAFGYYHMTRAKEAESKAHAMRGEAEKLIVYLLDDFYLELEPVGRLDIVAELSRRALEYYATLSPEMRTPQTERNRALAQVRYGHVMRYLGKLDDGAKALDEAIPTLTRLRTQGDQSEAAAIGLAVGIAARARIMDSQSRSLEAYRLAQEAARVLEPLMAAQPSIPVRRAYGSVMNYLGFAQLRQALEGESVKSLERARSAYRSIDNLAAIDTGTAGSLAAAAGFAEATSWQMEGLQLLGRLKEAQTIGEEAAKVAARVLEQRPGHMPALRAHGLLTGSLAGVFGDELQYTRAIELSREGERDWLAYLRLDAGNSIARNNLSSTRSSIAFLLQASGRVPESLAAYAEVQKSIPKEPGLAANFVFLVGRAATLQADAGQSQDLAPYRKIAESVVATLPKEAYERFFFTEVAGHFDRQVAMAFGRYDEVRQSARATLQRLQASKPADENQSRNLLRGMASAHFDLAWASYNLRDYAAAAAEFRKALEPRAKLPLLTRLDRLEMSEVRTYLALALARNGEGAEAVKIAEAEGRMFRELIEGGSEDMTHRVSLARALLAVAFAQPSRKAALLAEARAAIEKTPAEMQRLASVAQLKGWIAEAAKRS
jgi:tetratricopeptide (TPR) repeat protein